MIPLQGCPSVAVKQLTNGLPSPRGAANGGSGRVRRGRASPRGSPAPIDGRVGHEWAIAKGEWASQQPANTQRAPATAQSMEAAQNRTGATIPTGQGEKQLRTQGWARRPLGVSSPALAVPRKKAGRSGRVLSCLVESVLAGRTAGELVVRQEARINQTDRRGNDACTREHAKGRERIADRTRNQRRKRCFHAGQEAYEV